MTRLPPDRATPILLAAVARGLADEVDARLAERSAATAISSTQLLALRSLGDGCSIAELGRRLGIAKQSAARTVDALAAKSLVIRSADPLDARQVIVSTSEAGAELLERADAATAEVVAEWRRDHGDAAIDALLALLYAIERDRLAAGPPELAG